MKKQIIAGIGVVLAAALIAGCGGGGGSRTSTPVTPSTGSAPVGPLLSSQTAPLSVTVHIPPASQTASARRNPAYVSPATSYITVTAAPSGTYGYGSCTSGTCTATIAAPVTTTSITVSLYNAQSGVLSKGTQAVTIVTGQANTVNMVFDGVVARLQPSSAQSQLVIGVSSTLTVTVAGYDASGYQILPPGDLVDVNGNVLISQTGSTQTVSLAASGPDAGYLSLGSLVWNSTTYQLTASGPYNDGGSGVQGTLTLTPQVVSSSSPVTLTPLNIPVNPKSIQVIADPANPPPYNQYTVTTTTPASTTDATVEIGLYPTPTPQTVNLAVVSNFNDAGQPLTVTSDNCESPGFSYNDPGIHAAFPSPGPTMPSSLSYAFTVNIAGPTPTGSSNVSCTFTVSDQTNGVNANVTFGLNSTTLVIQGKKRK